MSTCSPASSGGCKGSSKLSDELIHVEFGKLSAGVWILSEDKLKISIEIMTRNWKAAIDFINELSLLAESTEISHHPGTRYRYSNFD
jgi:pterin-4a-carbinolamine dehydratase